jgi:hypothetical protein
MAYVAMKTAVVYVTEEVTEGTAVAPTTGNQAVSILSDGFELQGEKELVERNNLTASLVKALPRVGIKTATGSIGVECKASATAGAKPEADLLFHAALGGVRQVAATVPVASNSTNTTVVNVADASLFNVGDTIMIKSTNVGFDGYHISPITTVTTGGAEESVTLLVPMTNNAQELDVIEKLTTYYSANTGHPSLTITSYMEDAIKFQASGVRVNSLSLESFETGQIASFSFGLQGQNYTETLAASGLTAAFDGATPPLILNACVYRNGVRIPVQNVSLSVENTIATVQSTCSPNGVIAQRVTEQAISGSITPYMDTTSVALFSAFDANTEFSLFFHCQNPGATGVKKEAIAFYIPTCICTALPKSDADGLMQYALEFSAGPNATGTGAPLYISFI